MFISEDTTITIHRPYSTVYINEDHVKKIMTKNYIHLNNDGWLDKYNHLREYCPQLVKIYSINDNEMIMEKVIGINVDDYKYEDTINVTQLFNISININLLISQLYNFSKHEGEQCIHRDLTLSNIIDVGKGELKIIDPESIWFNRKLNNFPYLKTQIQLTELFTIIGNR